MKQIWSFYLLAMIGCILHTLKISIRPAIKICVLSTDVSISSKARPALAAVHGICKMAQVVAASVLVAVMAAIEAGITRRAHLRQRQIGHHPSVREQVFTGNLKPFSVLSFTCFLEAASSTPLPNGCGPV